MNFIMFNWTTVQYIDTKIYSVMQQAPYMIPSFLLTMKDVFDKEKEKQNTGWLWHGVWRFADRASQSIYLSN